MIGITTRGTNMTTNHRVIDGDTIQADGSRIRISGIDTAEKDTDRGKQSINFAKALLPSERDIKVEEYEKDIWGRDVSATTLTVNGKDIDYGLVMLDQRQSDYFTNYGEHQDPSRHEQYKAYYSDYSKYQSTDSHQPLNKAQFEAMTSLHDRFTKVKELFLEGEATQEDLDNVTAALYSDPDKVVRYRQDLFDMTRPTFDDGTLRYAYQESFENMRPEDQALRDLAVRNTDTLSKTNSRKLQEEPSAWEKLKTSFKMFNTVAQASDYNDMKFAREYGRGVEQELPDSVLLQDVPPQYQSMVLSEADQNGDLAGYTLKQQLLVDLENNTLWDNMALYEQLGYGVLAFGIDPLTLAGVGVGKAVHGSTVATNLAAQSGRLQATALAAGKPWAATGVKVGSATGVWAVAGSTEEAARGSIRFAADHTYNVKDLQMDILVGGIVSGALPIAGYSVKGLYDAALKFNKQKQIARAQKNRADIIGDLPEDTTKRPQSVVVQKEHLVSGASNTRVVDGGTPKPINVSTIGTSNVRYSNRGQEVELLANNEASGRVWVGPEVDGYTRPEIDVNTARITDPLAQAALFRAGLVIAQKLSGSRKARLVYNQTNKLGKVRRQVLQELVDDGTVMYRSHMDKEGVTNHTYTLLQPIKEAPYVPREIPSERFKLTGEELLASRKSKESKKPPKVVEPINTQVGQIPTPEYTQQVTDLADTPKALEFNSNRFVDTIAKDKEEAAQIKADANDVYLQKVQGSIEKHQQQVDYYKNHERSDFQNMNKSTLSDYIADTLSLQWMGNIFTDVATRFQNSGLPTLEWVGLNVTEMGKGFHGKTNRKHTAALIKDHENTLSQIKVLPQYHDAMNQYAASKGKGAVGQLQAAWEGGKANPIADAFHREIFEYQEARRLGKTLPEVTDAVKKFADDWDRYMAYNHDKMVGAKLDGFTAERKINNYIPRQWSPVKLQAMIKKVGKSNVVKLIDNAFREMDARQGTVRAQDSGAKDFIKWVEEMHSPVNKHAGSQAIDLDDAFTPTVDLHSRERLNFDMTTAIEVDGERISLLDLINTELPEIATKYSERMSGYIGLSKATNGAVSSPLDVQTLRESIKHEALVAGKTKGQLDAAIAMYDDTMDAMFGRPTKLLRTESTLSRAEKLKTGTNYTGIPKGVRQIKDLTALTQLGALGAAQLAETGNVITRQVMRMFSDPKAAAKMIKKSGVDMGDMDKVYNEISAVTGLTKEIEYLQRQTVHLDQLEQGQLGKLSQLSDALTDAATFGKYKAASSRLLAKTTGFNAIRNWQNKVAQTSTTMDIARQFRFGKGSMSHERIRDLGLDDPKVKMAVRSFVEFNDKGYPVAMNFDKWPKATLDKFVLGVHRDSAQAVQRTMVGEKPAWLNRPIMQVITQYMEMPLIAMNKQLGRQVAFADKEAVVNAVLAASVAGLSKYAWDELSRTVTGKETERGEIEDMDSLVQSDAFQALKYTPYVGIYPDALEWINTGINNDGDVRSKIPILSTLQRMYDTTDEAAKLSTGEGSAKDFFDTSVRLVPLSNTIYAKGLLELIDEMMKKENLVDNNN
jgi:hypothetical protein